MTKAQQRRFYFPIWNACAATNHWVMVRGRLVADLAQQCGAEGALRWSEPARAEMLKVITLAYDLAAATHCAVTADHLRHACNLAAAGVESSLRLDNKQINRVVTLFKLLKDPEDLDAVMDWLNPENADRRSCLSFLKKKAPEGTIIAISKNAFGTIFWEDLELSKLRWLAKQLKGRGSRGEAANAKLTDGGSAK